MKNKIRLVIRTTLAAAVLVAITLAVTASSLAQGLPGAETVDSPLKVFLPLITRNYSAPTSTSFELIEQALERGEIDQETALVYKVFAVFLDPRLPGQFKGNDSPARDSWIMGEIAASWSSLSPGTQALLEPFFLPPTAPGSWLELQAAQDQPAIAGTQADAGKKPAAASSQAAIEWVSLSKPGGGVKVWYQTRYPGDDALAAQILEDMEKTVWPALTNLMGRGPRGDEGLPNNGGDGLYDIYLVRIKDHGQSVPYKKLGCQNIPSYALVNGTTSQLRSTITHEFFHAIIWGYSFATGCMAPEYLWLNEASATWSEDYISKWFDTGNSEHNYASAFLGYPDFPLESLGESHEYGAYLWPFYLAETFQPEIIRAIWDATGSKDSLAAIDGAIPGGFLEQWPVFSRLNLNQPPVDEYTQWDNLDAQATFYDYRPVELANEKELKIPMLAYVNHLGARSFLFSFNDPKVNKVRFENGDRFFSGAEPRAKVQALVKIEGQEWALEDWTNLPERKFCRSKPAERIEELAIIFSNSEWENRLDVLDPGTSGPALWFNDEPCSCEELSSVQKWTGQVEFSFTTSASDGAKTISYNHSATVNLLMGLDYQDSFFSGWTDVNLGGTGEVNDNYDNSPRFTATLAGSGALNPGGPMQDDPSASLSLFTSTCTFKFHLQTSMPAQHIIRYPLHEETYSISGGVGFMDINDIPASQLTGSRTVPAVWMPFDEPSWYVPGSVFDSDLALMVGHNLGEAIVSWSFSPAD